MNDLNFIESLGLPFSIFLSLAFSALFCILLSKCVGLTIPTSWSAHQKDEKQVFGLKDIPSIRPTVPFKLIGNMPQLLPFTSSLDKGMKWMDEHPGLFRFIGANSTFVTLNSCSLIQQLFKSNEFGHNMKSDIVYDFMKPFISNGLLVSSGKFWQGQRKLLLKTQSFQALKAYMEMLNKHSSEFIQQLEQLFQDGKPRAINETINVLFLKVICEMITGNEIETCPEFDRYHHNFQLWKEAVLTRIPWFINNTLWKVHPMSRRQNKAIQEMSDFAKKRIREHKEKMKSHQQLTNSESENRAASLSGSGGNSTFRCMLDDLIEAGVNDDQIVDEVNTMLFGGHETGATAIHFFCLCMALHPEIQTQCRREVDEAFANSDNGQLTYEAVQSSLKYLERCIQETMRLFPPVFIVLRRLDTALSLEYENRLFKIPKDTILVVSALANHRNPKLFPNPKMFDPDRFLPEEVAKRDTYAYMPFSGGPRNCLGLKFAMIEMKVFAAYLIRNFEISTREKSLWDVPLMPFITLTPMRDYIFDFKKRV